MMRSRRALEDQRLGRDTPEEIALAQATERASQPPDDAEAAYETVMYRGKAIRRPVSGGAKGPGNAAASRPAKANVDLGAALKRLAELHQQGLLSRAEYDQKRLQILDRL